MKRIRLNPITRKRLQRFRKIRHAWWSFWSLVVLYGVGLSANLLCNDLPLYVRYGDRHYFPFLFYYPEDVFTGSGRMTRVNYKELAQSEAFQAGSGNRMIFAWVPFGPHESIPATSIDVSRTVRVNLERERRVASLDVLPDLAIAASASAAPFFGVETERSLRGRRAGDVWPFSDALNEAVARRFQNLSSPAYAETLRTAHHPEAEVSIAPYVARTRPPRTVRLTFRETVAEGASLPAAEYAASGEMITAPPAWWTELSEPVRADLLAQVQRRFEQAIRPVSLELPQGRFVASFEKEDVYYPFRPTPRHPLGLDSAGRDVLVRIVYALRTSMTFGILLVAVTMLAGVLVGAIQGYYGGRVDLAGQRLIEIWESLPFLYILILMGSVFGRGFLLLLVCYGIFNWVGISYYMRGEFLKTRALPFVEAARCLGLPSHTIILRHILPNSLVPLITFFPFSLVSAIGILAALDYLGFGLPPPTPSWGELLAQAQEFRYAWWLVLYPSLALFVVMLLGVFVGEGIRNAFDPRSSSRME